MTVFASVRARKRRSCRALLDHYAAPGPPSRDGEPVWQGNHAPLYAHVQPTDLPWAHAVLVDPVLPHDVDEYLEALGRMSGAAQARMPGGPAGTSAARFVFHRPEAHR